MPAPALQRLPTQLADFAAAFADTGDGAAAARSIGVHPSRAKRFAKDTLADPRVKEAVAVCLRNRYAEAGPLALNALVELTSHKDPNVKLAAAKDLANRSGFTAKDMRDAAAEDSHRDLAEMSPEQLRRVLEETEAELASRAKLVEKAPEIGTSAAQVIDLEG